MGDEKDFFSPFQLWKCHWNDRDLNNLESHFKSDGWEKCLSDSLLSLSLACRC